MKNLFCVLTIVALSCFVEDSLCTTCAVDKGINRHITEFAIVPVDHAICGDFELQVRCGELTRNFSDVQAERTENASICAYMVNANITGPIQARVCNRGMAVCSNWTGFNLPPGYGGRNGDRNSSSAGQSGNEPSLPPVCGRSDCGANTSSSSDDLVVTQASSDDGSGLSIPSIVLIIVLIIIIIGILVLVVVFCNQKNGADRRPPEQAVSESLPDGNTIVLREQNGADPRPPEQADSEPLQDGNDTFVLPANGRERRRTMPGSSLRGQPGASGDVEQGLHTVTVDTRATGGDLPLPELGQHDSGYQETQGPPQVMVCAAGDHLKYSRPLPENCKFIPSGAAGGNEP